MRKRIIFLIIAIIIILFAIIKIEILIINYEKFSFWLYPKNPNRNGELFKVFLSILGAIGILFGIYISYRRAKAIESGVQKQGEVINLQSEQINLTRKSQIDERFKNGVEHLSSNNEPIILGGIAELNQIAKENHAEYSEIVFDIFCSYLRSTSRESKRNKTILKAIINYLFKISDENPYLKYSADLQGADLSGIPLENVSFRNSYMFHTKLPYLLNSSLEGANLLSTVFSKIDNVKFNGAKFRGARLYGGAIRNCDLSNIDNSEDSIFHFIGSTVENVNFDNCILHGWQFLYCQISNCSFDNSKIFHSKFCFSNFNNIKFNSVNEFKMNDLRASCFENVVMKDIEITHSLFNGCRKKNPYPISAINDIKNIKEQLSNLENSKSDLSGIEQINVEFTYCKREKLSKIDIVELFEFLESYNFNQFIM
ncbi:pentapeptide repeat-containing protein [Jejuia spongiicola]|uniref:Pentapeptide repeat-containing protein n=1 Tax=Jejuia spongiicola TaxID=2942207 RepID=A0ABT0QA83_9FLAO|nr:pentapeptide repeat-containing protein [Jejuia spongiicola]MCL6293895.1 pentapeptide repeat-containing protein [Jejuia spongiicola]